MYKLNKIIPIAILLITSVVLAQPTLNTPPNGCIIYNTTPLFDWSDESGAIAYRIQVDDTVDFSSPMINTTTTISEYQVLAPITFAESCFVYWRVRVDDPLGDWSETWTLIVINKPTNLIYPPADGVIHDPTPIFWWEQLSGAVCYRLVVTPSGGIIPVIDATITNTTYTPVTNLTPGDYYWKVVAKDELGNWGVDSENPLFTLFAQEPGWVQKESMPSPGAPKKYVKDGASMVGVLLPGEYVLYAFRGSKSNEFWKYVTDWVSKESLLYGYKPDKPTKINKKTVGKGASLCYDGSGVIYATKGNGTTEFWAYNIAESSWSAKRFVPVPKTLKGGTSIAYLDGKVYLLAGGHKPTDPTNFYSYDAMADTWRSLQGVHLGPTYKPWKDGSCLTELSGTIHALKGGDKTNLFFAYDTLSNTWTACESIPTMDSIFGKYKKVLVKDGGTMTSGDGVIYAVKGGGANVFWKYATAGGWIPLESIPRLHKKSVPKTGATLAYRDGEVYLLKGNNTPEFWKYTPAPVPVTRVNPTTITSLTASTTPKQTINIMSTPFSNIVRYTVPVGGKVTIKLYNAIGRLVETMHNGDLNAGTYTMNISHVASGVYFLRYEDNTSREEIKLIVQ